MPYSFTQIEKSKSQTILIVLFCLVGFYFLSFLVITLVVFNFLGFYASTEMQGVSYHFAWPKLHVVLTVLFFAFFTAFAHWYYTTDNLLAKILKILSAEPLKENDKYHQMFKNIIEEVSVATGGQKIEGVVVPNMSMNAFALADFDGRAVIGITEGLLARLNRAQLEAVVGHEAAHIVSGDCLETTISSSIFELYSALLKGLETIFSSGGSRSYRVRGKGNSAAVILIMIIYALLKMSQFFACLFRMFISRQREYRADAVAVRLTRDPLSLSEALYSLAYHWRGSGLASQELEAIFIMNPNFSRVEGGSGLFSDLFSTHPPLDKRISVLLNMAHADVRALENSIQKAENRARTIVPEPKAESYKWMVKQEGQWQGPYDLIQMLALEWVRPDTWIKRIGRDKVMKTQEDKDLMRGLMKDKKCDGIFVCPKCHVPLHQIYYEGVEIHKCVLCHGSLIEGKDVEKILLREEVGFSDRIKKIAEGLKEQDKHWSEATISRDPKTLLKCPQCESERARMMRTFYTAAYKIEVDRCLYCDMIWFDQDELEVLQYLVEEADRQ